MGNVFHKRPFIHLFAPDQYKYAGRPIKRCFRCSKSVLTNSRNCLYCSLSANSELNNRHCFRRLVISVRVIRIRHLIVRPSNPYALLILCWLGLALTALFLFPSIIEGWILAKPKDGVCKEQSAISILRLLRRCTPRNGHMPVAVEAYPDVISNNSESVRSGQALTRTRN